MTVHRVSSPPVATHGETVRCLFAIELSKQSWVIGFTTPLSAKISRRILSGGDWKGLLELIEEVRASVSREIGRAVEVYCGPVLRHPAELLPAVDLGGRVWLGGKPCKGWPAAPRLRRLTALTGLATQPSFATKNSTARSG